MENFVTQDPKENSILDHHELWQALCKSIIVCIRIICYIPNLVSEKQQMFYVIFTWVVYIGLA